MYVEKIKSNRVYNIEIITVLALLDHVSKDTSPLVTVRERKDCAETLLYLG